ncbi:MAG: MFS transporter [Chromatiales bacterium]|nr:MFS transporter [Chromatiales bacterium]
MSSPEGDLPPLSAVMRELIGSVYVPSFLAAIAQNAVMIMLPLYALQFEGGAALAAVMLGARGAGVMIADVPAGVLVSRLGDKWVMTAGLLLLVVVTLVAALFQSPIALLWVALGSGIATGLWLIARLAYITDTVAGEQRGRVIAVMAGVHRASALIGPVLAGVSVQVLDYAATFIICAVIYACSLVVLFFTAKIAHHKTSAHHVPLLQVVQKHRRTFATAGTVMIILQFLRGARLWIIPVWGATLGLDEATIGFVFSASSLIDMAMFYPVGLMLDHLGRRTALTPALIILSASIALMPFTNTLWTFAACAVLTGLGNGFSTGIFMTLGGDFSPPEGRGEFLGVWRLVGDIGTATGPFLIGGLAQLGSVIVAGTVTGGLGLVGVAILWVWVPETLRKRAVTNATRGASG